MKETDAMTTSALKGSTHLNIMMPTFSFCQGWTCEEEFEQAFSIFIHNVDKLNLNLKSLNVQ